MQIKDRQRFLTIVVIAGVSLLALDQLVRPPLMRLWDNRQKELQSLQAQVKHGELMHRRKEGIRSEWAEIQAASLPNDPTLAEQQLIGGFDRWAESSGVAISSIVPQPKTPSDEYKTIECRVDASGSIDRLARFLYDVESDPMAIKLQSVELTASDNTGQTLGLGLQVSALVLTPKTPAAATAKSTPAK